MPYQNRIASIGCRHPSGSKNFKHGGCTLKLFLPDENPADFFLLLEDAFALYQPRIKRDAALAADTVYARWFLLRRQRAYDHYEYGLCVRKPDVAEWTVEENHKLRLLDRYKIRAERAMRRAMSNVEHIRKNSGRRNRWPELYEREKASCQRFLDPSKRAA